jgi:hypothetical protein
MNDESLLLYYFDDGLSDRERHEIEASLAADASLASRYAGLCAQLDAWNGTPTTPLPEQLLHRWHHSIAAAARQERARRRNPVRSVNLPSFAWGAVISAALALVIGIGINRTADESVRPAFEVGVEAGAAPVAVTSRAVFERSMELYLRDARQDLTMLGAQPADDRMLLVRQIIEQNRLFERTAANNDAQDLARVLRAFEPILLRLAADDVAPADAEALRVQLAFELDVMLTKLGRDTSKQATST